MMPCAKEESQGQAWSENVKPQKGQNLVAEIALES